MRSFLLAASLVLPAAAPATAHADIIVQRAPGADRAELRANAGVEHVRTLGLERTDLVTPAAGESPQHALAALRADPDVVFAEVDRPAALARVADGAFGDLWGLRNTGQNAGLAGADIDVLGAWQHSEGLGVTVAVVDTGINADHEDLTGQLASTKAELEGVPGIDDDGNGYVDDVQGWDFLGRDNVAQDGSGHGTHVAGTLAAAGGNGLGVVGVAPRAKVLPLRVLGDDGKGTMSAVASAFDYAGELGVRVVNASVGGAYSAAVRTAIAAHPDTLYVVAAGNDTLDADTASGAFPCALPEPNVVCVGATDNRDALAGFSNFGATAVDLFAPGVNIVSTGKGAANAYALMSGTSMAAPHVSGVVALELGADPAASTAALRQALLSSVDAKPALGGRSVTGGRLNASRAVTAVTAPGAAPTPAPTPTPTPPAPTPAPAPPVATPTPAAPKLTPVPLLSKVVVSGSLRTKQGRLKVSFHLTGAASVGFTVKRHGSRAPLARWARRGRAGTNVVTLSRRLPTGKVLKPGRYVVTVK